MGMDELIAFLQIDLERNFGYLDDRAIKELEATMRELK